MTTDRSHGASLICKQTLGHAQVPRLRPLPAFDGTPLASHEGKDAWHLRNTPPGMFHLLDSTCYALALQPRVATSTVPLATSVIERGITAETEKDRSRTTLSPRGRGLL